jgi:Protein of unknown function (DUF2752)
MPSLPRPTAARAGVVRRTTPWWYAAAAAAGTAYLYVADPTRPGNHAILPCPFKAITGLDCPGCGTTRATWAMVHGHPLRAVGYNALWCALVPLLVWAWTLDVRGTWSAARHPFHARWFAHALAATALVFAVARNLPWAPLRALHS